jgi:hypothetical protein
MSVMYSYDLTAEGPAQDVDRLEDAIRRGELGDLYNGTVIELPEGSAVRSTSGDPDPLTDKWLKASFLVKYGCIGPILHVAELFPTLRFRGSFQSDMEFEEAHYEFEACQGDITLLEQVRYKRIRLIPNMETNIFDELNEISAVLQRLEARAYHTADNDLVGNVTEITRVLDHIDARPVRESQAKPVKSVAELEDEMSSLVEKLNARAEGPRALSKRASAATEGTT